MTAPQLSAPAAPVPERLHLAWRFVLAAFAACSGGELGEPARQVAEALAEIGARADRRETRVAARGQLRLLDPGPRCYPALPVLRRRRRST